jgi:hypothetical protein
MASHLFDFDEDELSDLTAGPHSFIPPNSDLYKWRTRIMTVEEWIRVPDHPRQRNTVYHARVASKKHLRTPHPFHIRVEAAVHPVTGQLHKVDAHTRAYLWNKGSLSPAPDYVFALIYLPDDEDEFNLFYLSHDNQGASKTSADDLYGLLNEMGLLDVLTSSLLRGGKFGQALATVWGWSGGIKARWDEVPELIQQWVPELLMADECCSPRMNGTTLACIMLTCRRYGKAVIPFWSAVGQGQGQKTNGVSDPVQAAIDVINQTRPSTQAGRLELLGRLLTCVERNRKGKWSKAMPRVTNVEKFRAKLRHPSPWGNK